MSDLQCPAKVILMVADAVSATSVAGGRYAGVFVASPIAIDPSDFTRMDIVADQVGCRVQILTDAVDGASLRRAIDGLADLYRGETILVIAARDMIHALSERMNDSTGLVAFAIDSSGWVPLEIS